MSHRSDVLPFEADPVAPMWTRAGGGDQPDVGGPGGAGGPAGAEPWGPQRRYGRRGRLLTVLVALAVSIVVAIAGIWLASSSSVPNRPVPNRPVPNRSVAVRPSPRAVVPRNRTGVIAWPASGEAAVAVSGRLVGTSGGSAAVPIASLAKMMTAYVLLQDHPLSDPDGLTLTIDRSTVTDTAHRRRRGESVVEVEVGERLTERQALEAILLPSANNIAVALARRDAGSVAAFVARMNATARRLGMIQTRYTDPSGYDPATVSTARDQLRLTYRALLVPAFAQLVALPTARIPVAGAIANTDTLLGHDGFVGAKTGSDDAAGGCFAFARTVRRAGRTNAQIGVVLGQRGGPLVPAALAAARVLVDSLSDRR